MTHDKYEMVLQFDDDSPSFTHGFQAGCVWEKMNSGEPFQYTFNGAVLELVEKNAEQEKVQVHNQGAWRQLVLPGRGTGCSQKGVA